MDVTVCADCGSTMKIIAALTHPQAIRTYFDEVSLAQPSARGVGLASRPPPVAPPRPQPQTSFEFDYT